ncbi:MAG: urate hydroxylase PuuD, partial [Pseudomonadota bacterium]
FGTPYAWIIASLVFLLGVTIRHFFNSMHAGKGRPYWTWAVTVVIFISIAWLSGARPADTYEVASTRAFTPLEARYASAVGFEEAAQIVQGRCSMCHAREPVWEGIRWAPKGVYLETKTDIARHAEEIYLQAGISHAMPPAAAVEIDQADRDRLVAWFRAAN